MSMDSAFKDLIIKINTCPQVSVVPEVSIIGRKDGTVAMVSCSLGKPYALANLTFCGCIFFYIASEKNTPFY